MYDEILIESTMYFVTTSDFYLSASSQTFLVGLVLVSTADICTRVAHDSPIRHRNSDLSFRRIGQSIVHVTTV
jgi:hypothetical protein